MESGTFTCHKEGSACEPFAAVSDTDHAHGNDEEQPQREGRSVADLASEEMQGEEVQSEEQAESVDHAMTAKAMCPTTMTIIMEAMLRITTIARLGQPRRAIPCVKYATSQSRI
jgi:hypothetical protein